MRLREEAETVCEVYDYGYHFAGDGGTGTVGSGDVECSFVITVSEEERTTVALTLVVGGADRSEV